MHLTVSYRNNNHYNAHADIHYKFGYCNSRTVAIRRHLKTRINRHGYTGLCFTDYCWHWHNIGLGTVAGSFFSSCRLQLRERFCQSMYWRVWLWSVQTVIFSCTDALYNTSGISQCKHKPPSIDYPVPLRLPAISSYQSPAGPNFVMASLSDWWLIKLMHFLKQNNRILGLS